jgi:hypothetical protein
VEWIYMALDHVQQLWEENRNDFEDSHTWDFRTAKLINTLLQMLASSGTLPEKPPLKAFHIVLRAFSAAHTRFAAFMVLHHARNWFLDPDLQQMILESAVWPHVASIALNHPPLYGWRYIDMIEKVAHGPEWKACLYPELYTWLTVFAGVAEFGGLKEWCTLERFATVIRSVWVPDLEDNPPHTFAAPGEERWALTISALSNVWGGIDFTYSPLWEVLRLATCTFAVALLPSSGLSHELFAPKLISPNIKTTFCARLGESLTQAVVNARKVLTELSESDVSPNKQGLERIAELLEVLGEYLETKGQSLWSSGEVFRASVSLYDGVWRVPKLFEDKLDEAEKIIDAEIVSLSDSTDS